MADIGEWKWLNLFHESSGSRTFEQPPDRGFAFLSQDVILNDLDDLDDLKNGPQTARTCQNPIEEFDGNHTTFAPRPMPSKLQTSKSWTIRLLRNLRAMVSRTLMALKTSPTSLSDIPLFSITVPLRNGPWMALEAVPIGILEYRTQEICVPLSLKSDRFRERPPSHFLVTFLDSSAVAIFVPLEMDLDHSLPHTHTIHTYDPSQMVATLTDINDPTVFVPLLRGPEICSQLILLIR